ncbi:MAG: STAS domain-containing protein [Bacteroidales bacterium]|nr:STAS domain-containing protein [Bacteroidales bacterium]
MLKTEKKDGIYIISFEETNRFNALTTESVKAEVKALYNSPNTRLVLNLKGISFIDSSGFGVFLSIMKTANNNYGFFKISNISEEVMELFKLLQLHNVFEIYNNVDDALKSFN